MNTLLLTFVYLFIFLGFYLFTFYPFTLSLIEKYRPKLEAREKILLSLLLSSVGFVFLAFIAGVIQVRFLVLPILVVLNVYGLWRLKSKALTIWKEFFRDKLLILLLLVSIMVQGVINFPSGYKYQEGLKFWSSQGHDGLWHVTLLEEIKKTMPPQNPIYVGERLYNYHYLADVLMGEFGRIYPIFSSLDIYFRFYPVILSFLINLSVFTFLSYWKKSRLTGYWGILFTSLFGNFGYIVTFIKSGKLFSGETIFWASQANTIIGNPPHAAAYGLLSGALFCLAVYLRTKDRLFLLLSFILGSLLAGFKVSGGVVLVAGVLFAGVVDLLINKKKSLIFLGLLFLLSNFGVLKLMTREAASLLIFEPWWFIRTMIVDGARVGWIDLELRRQFYLDRGGWRSFLRIVEYESIAFLIFVIGNLGTRIIVLIEPLGKGLKGIKDFFSDMVNLILVGIGICGLGVVLLFVQRGIIYNLIQFLQYFILVLGFFAAVSVVAISKSIKNRSVKVVLATLLILFSVPTVIGNMVDFYGKGRTALAVIDNKELEALNYLKQNSKADEIILTLPFDENAHWGFKEQPWPISVWYSTGYVSAIASRRTYLTSEEQASLFGLPVKDRREEVLRFFAGKETSWSKQFLIEKKISYIYLIKRETKHPLNKDVLGLTGYFENDEVIIYQVI